MRQRWSRFDTTILILHEKNDFLSFVARQLDREIALPYPMFGIEIWVNQLKGTALSSTDRC